ncbi:MAG: hypothetical protein AAF108_08765 [Planctomycetota bacterium]
MTRFVPLAVAPCAGVLFVAVSPALAEPIEYTLSGRGEGFFAAQAFSNAEFSFSLFADTDDLTTTSSGFPRILIEDATVSVAGFGSGFEVTPDLSLVVNPGSPGGVAGLVLGNPTAGFALLIIDAGGLPQYDLASDFGPVTDTTPFDTELFTVATSGGLLTISTPFQVTFEAQVIPGPASAGALMALGLFARRRR